MIIYFEVHFSINSQKYKENDVKTKGGFMFYREADPSKYNCFVNQCGGSLVVSYFVKPPTPLADEAERKIQETRRPTKCFKCETCGRIYWPDETDCGLLVIIVRDLHADMALYLAADGTVEKRHLADADDYPFNPRMGVDLNGKSWQIPHF